MNTVKTKILEETFNQGFDLERFKRFVLEFFNEPEMFPFKKSTGIWREYSDHIAAYYKIGNYKDVDENNLLIIAVEIKTDKSVERARTMQRNFISKVLDQNNYEAAIVAFYSPNETNWRLSFVRLDYAFTEKGLELDLTPARRYSYLVGEGEPSHTAKAQLLPIFENDQDNPTLNEIEKAFSVEKVTKEFFEQYKEKYLQLKEYLEQDQAFITETEKLGFEVPKFAEQFSKKLLGQLAFLYFIQKKGWLGVRILPENHTLLESEYQKIYYENDDIHRDILERVFKKAGTGKRKISPIELFNLTDHEAELFSDCFVRTKFDQPWGSGERKFISSIFNHCINKTNKNFFDDYLQPLFYDALNKKRKNQYFNKFNCKIPFLNGGLFEPLEGYHWRDVAFSIPNSLFSNEKEKGRDADGILDIFERYNFTMNEDEPLEKEVAVDPEMLGKIFENLLDVKDRKSKGAFYTPREIVHYMCQESLINYLVNKVDVPYEDMKEFILYGELIRDTDSRSGVGYTKDFIIKPSIYKNIVNIDKTLENIKVADPAVGSGAFPVGMLSEIVRARNNITDYLVRVDKEGKFGRIIGEEVIRKNRSPYKLKRDTIKNSIFAVDIEPSAVDIAKLRLWLSVIVDQEINEEIPEPRPLPNLDMNIMVGNSLVDEYEGIKLFDEGILERKKTIVKESSDIDFTQQLSFLVDYSEEMLEEMFKLQDQYFDEIHEERKRDLKTKIEKLREQLIEYKLDRDGNKEGLKKYEELKKRKQKPYFLWYLEFAKVFQEKRGFDIVIGNPPYVDSEEMVKSMTVFREQLTKKYTTTKGNWDLYIPFWERSTKLLNSHGNVTLITPNKWLAIKYGETLRKYLFDKIYNITDYSTFKAFESADVSTVAVFASNIETENINVVKFNSEFTKVVEYLIAKQKISELDNLSICLSNSFTTLEKIIRYSSLSEYFTTEEAATVSETYEIAKYIHECLEGEEQKNYFKFINTGTIDKYRSLWGIKQMTYVKEKYLYPIILKKDLANNFNKRYEQAKSPKIITTGIRYFECFLDEKGEYLAAKSTVIIREKADLPLSAILPILNSNLVYYFLKEAYSGLAMGGGVNFTANNLSRIPIPSLNQQQIEELKKYSIKIQSRFLKNEIGNNLNLSTLLDEIDQFVYSLYDLNEYDIKVLEEFKDKNKRKKR